MHIDLFGLKFETPGVTFYLWSPWRAANLEHRLFEAIRGVPNVEYEEGPAEQRVRVRDPNNWKAVLQAIARVLKGWQEEADPGAERRSWRWLFDGDTDMYGYDHSSEPFSLWGIIQVSVERGGPGEQEKGEDLDLEGFGLRIWGDKGSP